MLPALCAKLYWQHHYGGFVRILRIFPFLNKFDF